MMSFLTHVLAVLLILTSSAWAEAPTSQAAFAPPASFTGSPDIINDYRTQRSDQKVAVVDEATMSVSLTIPLVHVPMNGDMSLDVTVSNIGRDQLGAFRGGPEWTWQHASIRMLSNMSIYPGITPYKHKESNQDLPLFLDPKGNAHLFYPGNDGRYYTQDGWKGALQYFKPHRLFKGWLTDPDGRRYEINRDRLFYSDMGQLSPLTRVEDITGHHWVNYEYVRAEFDSYLLKRITNSEGYIVTFMSDGPWWLKVGRGMWQWVYQVTGLHDNHGRHWGFRHKGEPGGGPPVLSHIDLPDGRAWELHYPFYSGVSPRLDEVRYPDGRRQTFTYLTNSASHRIAAENAYRLPPFGKTTYTHKGSVRNHQYFARWVEAKTGTKRVRTEFTFPSFSYSPTWDTALIKRVRTYEGNTLLQDAQYTWSGRSISSIQGGKQPLLTRVVIERDGLAYITEHSGFTAYGYPTQTIERSPLGARTFQRRYYEDPTKWVFKLQSEQIMGIDNEVFNQVEHTFNTLGQVTSTVNNGLYSEYSYDSKGNLASVSDALGNTTLYQDYIMGKPRTVRGPGTWTHSMYNELGLPLKEEDLAHGSEKRYTYDILGRETSMSQTGYDTRYTKWDTPNKGDRTVIQGKKKVVHRLRDRSDGGAVLDRITEVYTLTHDGKQYFSIDRLGLEGRLLAQYEMGLQGEERLKYRYTYDALGRLLEKRYKDAEGNYGVERHQYFGNRTRVSTPIGHWTTYWCQRFADPDQCTVTKIRNAEDHETLIERDIMGRVRQIEQGGVTHRYTYDPLTHLLMAVHHPESGATTYQYNSAGRKTSMIRADGQQTTYHYNGAHQLTHIGYPDGRYRDNAYDYGRMTKTENATSQWTYHYKPSGQLREATFTDKETGDAYRFAYEYDPLGPMSKITYPDGRVVDYHPDPLGRPTKVNGIHGLSYTPSGMLIGYHTPAGHHVTIPVDSRLTRPGGLKVTQGNQTLIDVEYLYDVLRVYEVNDHLPAQQHQHKFGYDGTDQLIYDKSPVGDWYYSYDDHGNITSQTYQGARTDYHYNALNRLSALSGNHAFDLSYDALGRVTSRDGVDLSYNAADLVTRMHKDGRTVEYRYDPYGKRYKIIEGDKTSLQLHLKHKLYYEKREGHEIDHVFLKGQHIANIKDNGETTYFFNNLIGSPLLESSDAGQQHQDYNAYGQEHERDTREPHTSFAGKQSSPGFGMVDMHARQYDPVIGRFLAPDPADIDPTKWLTVNRYVYANNSPYMFVDPDGEWAVFVGGLVGGIMGGYTGYMEGGLKASAIGTIAGTAVGVMAPIATGRVALGLAVRGTSNTVKNIATSTTFFGTTTLGNAVLNKTLTGKPSWDSSIISAASNYLGGKIINPMGVAPQSVIHAMNDAIFSTMSEKTVTLSLANMRPAIQNASTLPIRNVSTYQPYSVTRSYFSAANRQGSWHAPMRYKTWHR